MESQIYYIAQIATIDERLAELHEDYGSLPDQIKDIEAKYTDKKNLVDETQNMLDELINFVARAKNILVDLKDKEEKLTQQQFQVRNNKEFDAITTEIAHIKSEHEKLSNDLRTSGVKQENLNKILDDQKIDLDKAKIELDDIYAEEKRLAGSQMKELETLRNKRIKLMEFVKIKYMKDYERVHKMHSDAAVRIKNKNCSGCFSVLPPQLIVEVRNNLNHVYLCEFCGRLLIPEELIIESAI